jgi:pimeloyl-ACP methyl ester carboxylesterase
MAFYTTNDGVKIYYEEKGEGKPLIMLHGWGCSPNFFKRNVDELAKCARVINASFRGHYKSDKVKYGHRISRYAADLRDLILELGLEDEEVTVLGWSMGGAVIWSHYELFQDDYIDRMIIVDQSPRQYLEFGGQGWTGYQVGCYDHESLQVLNTTLLLNSRGVAEGLGAVCFPAGVSPTSEETQFFADEIEYTPGWVRATIMTDHTNLDWRDLMPKIDIPTLVIVGKKSQIWGDKGAYWPGEHTPGAKMVEFTESGHMPFYNEAEKFNQVVCEFLQS